MVVITSYPFWRGLGGVITRWTDYRMPGVQQQITRLKRDLADLEAAKQASDAACAEALVQMESRFTARVEALQLKQDTDLHDAIGLREKLMQVFADNDRVRAENSQLRAENDGLRAEIEGLKHGE